MELLEPGSERFAGAIAHYDHVFHAAAKLMRIGRALQEQQVDTLLGQLVLH